MPGTAAEIYKSQATESITFNILKTETDRASDGAVFFGGGSSCSQVPLASTVFGKLEKMQMSISPTAVARVA